MPTLEAAEAHVLGVQMQRASGFPSLPPAWFPELQAQAAGDREERLGVAGRGAGDFPGERGQPSPDSQLWPRAFVSGALKKEPLPTPPPPPCTGGAAPGGNPGPSPPRWSLG